MIEFRKGDIFLSNCEAITNAVNCVGNMGKGIAFEFKKRFPDMFYSYQKACQTKELTPGKLHTWKNDDGLWIINFPTKIGWWSPTEYNYVNLGFVALGKFVKDNEIKSIAIPALGCGLGGLKWDKVLRIIKRHHEQYFHDILFVVYEPYNDEKIDK